MQRKVSAYFGLENVMDLQLFNVTVEQNSENQHQRALEFVEGTRITSAGVAICTWVEMDIHRPIMKGKKWYEKYLMKIIAWI